MDTPVNQDGATRPVLHQLTTNELDGTMQAHIVKAAPTDGGFSGYISVNVGRAEGFGLESRKAILKRFLLDAAEQL